MKTKLSLLTVIVAAAALGLTVLPTAPQAGLDMEIPVPREEGCFAAPTGIMVHDGFAFVDTIPVPDGATSVLFSVPDVPGLRQYRALAYLINPDTGEWIIGRVPFPNLCTLTGDTLWGLWSGPVNAQPSPGQPGQPVVIPVLR